MQNRHYLEIYATYAVVHEFFDLNIGKLLNQNVVIALGQQITTFKFAVILVKAAIKLNEHRVCKTLPFGHP